MDSILLDRIRVRTRIGVPDAERASEQLVLVTVELLHPLKVIGTSDDIRDGIDYQTVTERVVSLGKTGRKTVEHLAEDVATMILTDFRPQGGVKVTVCKTPDLPLESASVTIVRP
jgi:7,8-dihydroneopterin aldolase/epimerase/oxygenase